MNPPQHLSWNDARLVALVLNALSGLFGFFDDLNSSSPDTLFGLRMAQAALSQLHTEFNGNWLDPAIYGEYKNMSSWAEKIIVAGQERLKVKDEQVFEEVSFLIDRFRFGIQPYRKVDETWRWAMKSSIEVDPRHRKWLDPEDGLYTCLIDLRTCNLSNACEQKLIQKREISGIRITKKLLGLMVAVAKGCEKRFGEIATQNSTQGTKVPQNVNELVLETCTNVFDESSKLRKDPKKLARLTVVELELLMEQDACDERRSVVAVNALISALRLITDPPPWPESRLSVDQIIAHQLHQIPAEDRFYRYPYVNWVKDANLPNEYRLPRPPPNAWSPDLVAFSVLAFLFVAFSVFAHHAFTSRNQLAGIGPTPHNYKQYYSYAYKRL